MPFRGKYNNRKGGFNRGRGRRYLNTKSAHNRPKLEYRHQDQLTEEEVGITEYISLLEGFPGVIKARFSDFQVNEINLDGQIAKLTDISEPKSFAMQKKIYSYEDIIKSPLEIIPQDIWEALKNLVKNTDSEPVILDADNFSKDERKAIHICVKNHFGQEIVASTITKNGKSFLEFKKYNKGERATRLEWPDNTPEFVYFIVYKELMDTMEAILKISKALKISPTKITYAGVKDRRAKTSQWMCIKRYEPAKLIQKTKVIRNLHIGNIEFKDTSLKIGKLRGNRFRIALRNVIADDELIKNSIDQVAEHGFINYYGLQRFGNDKETPTFLIGIKLLQGQWREAIDIILKVKSGDDVNLPINQAKKLYAESRDANAALKLCEKWDNCIEKKLLEGLSKHHSEDYVNSLESIPRPMRLMYIHAFQSYIWNKMVSKRLHEFGLKPVEGDLIFVDNAQDEELLTEDENDETEEKDDNGSHDTKEEKREPPVRALKANDLDNFTIHDIVLPLPGYNIIYPGHMIEFYKEAIEEYGLSLEMPKQKVRSYNLSGTYRQICQKVRDLEYNILHYNDPTDNLIRSDLEELRGEEEPKSAEDGKYKTVVVSFTLNASSYATMVLREILKCNTSSSFQAGLNNYADSDKKSVVTGEPENEKGTNDNNDIQPGSLLADKDKYEDFKSKLFSDILGNADENSSHKRELDNGEQTENNSKKLKVDGEQN